MEKYKKRKKRCNNKKYKMKNNYSFHSKLCISLIVGIPNSEKQLCDGHLKNKKRISKN